MQAKYVSWIFVVSASQGEAFVSRQQKNGTLGRFRTTVPFCCNFCPACSGSSHDGVASQRGSESNPSLSLAPFR